MTLKGLLAAVFLASLLLAAIGAAGASGAAPAPASASPPSVAAAGTWTLLGTQTPARSSVGWVYDSRADRFIVFGGSPSFMNYTNITWSYDYTNNTWTNLTTTVGPSPRSNVAMVYDSAADRVILFGGSSNPLYGLNDTWTFDYANDTWTNVSATVRPGMRAAASMAYDPIADRTVLFGGVNHGNTLGDTWVYDYRTNTWTAPTVAGAPLSRSLASMVYDPTAHGPLLFGGLHSGTLIWFNDLYAYSVATATWSRLTPPASPPGRAGAGMAYDAAAQRTVLFGGTGGFAPSSYRNDTWAYSAAENLWANITPTVSPSARLSMGVAYDVRADRTVLYAGTLVTNASTDEAWSYRFGAVLPSAPVNLTAAAGTTVASLTWGSPTSDGGATITGYAIYRGTTSGGETLLTTTGPTLTYTDTAVTPGVTYYYEVAAINSVGTGPRSNEASAAPTPATPDTTPPAIAITSPANSSVLPTTAVTVNGTSSDNVEVAKVEVSLDGTNWTPATGTTAWTAALTLPAGTDTIYARATDTSGNRATARITVTVRPSTSSLVGTSGDLWVVLFIIAVVVIAAVAVLLIRRPRRPSPAEPMPPPIEPPAGAEPPAPPPPGPPRGP